jgi:PIN domain nuclease of toxin-antitoxin system
MRLLVDTNTLIWLIGESYESSKMGPRDRKLINEADMGAVSSISVLEIRIKTMPDKLASPVDLLEAVTAAGLKFIAFDEFHADAITDLQALSRHDPFNRMLLAQAKRENMNLLTADLSLLNLNLPYVISARE